MIQLGWDGIVVYIALRLNGWLPPLTKLLYWFVK